MQILEHIPDSLKIAASTGPSVVTLFGIPMEQWTYVASAVVSVMFVIEKMPVMIKRLKEFYAWMREVKDRWKA